MPPIQGGRQELYEQCSSSKMTVKDNLEIVLSKLEELEKSLTKNGILVTKPQVHARFASIIPC